jgi:hypothetical protein
MVTDDKTEISYRSKIDHLFLSDYLQHAAAEGVESVCRKKVMWKKEWKSQRKMSFG